MNVKYDNMWDKYAFQHCRSKVKMTDAVLVKTYHGSSAYINELILTKLHTNVNYDDILDKFTFQLCMSKVKVTIAYGGGIHHL